MRCSGAVVLIGPERPLNRTSPFSFVPDVLNARGATAAPLAQTLRCPEPRAGSSWGCPPLAHSASWIEGDRHHGQGLDNPASVSRATVCRHNRRPATARSGSGRPTRRSLASLPIGSALRTPPVPRLAGVPPVRFAAFPGTGSATCSSMTLAPTSFTPATRLRAHFVSWRHISATKKRRGSSRGPGPPRGQGPGTATDATLRSEREGPKPKREAATIAHNGTSLRTTASHASVRFTP